MPRKFAMLVRASSEAEVDKPTTEMFEEMMAYNKQLTDAGMLLHADGFLPTAQGARLSYTASGKADDVGVTRGPFAPESTVAGYWIVQAKDLDEVIEWAKKIPFREGAVEVRSIAGEDDFGDAMTPELKKQHEEMRQKLEKK
jgi:hypothetical protein